MWIPNDFWQRVFLANLANIKYDHDTITANSELNQQLRTIELNLELLPAWKLRKDPNKQIFFFFCSKRKSIKQHDIVNCLLNLDNNPNTNPTADTFTTAEKKSEGFYLYKYWKYWIVFSWF